MCDMSGQVVSASIANVYKLKTSVNTLSMSNVYKRGLNGEKSLVHIVECIYQIKI